MFGVKYYSKNKKKLLPNVTDWSDPQNHLRYSNNVKKMAYNEWFYCHPSSHKLFFYGIPITILIIFAVMDLILWNLEYQSFVWFSLILIIPLLIFLGKRIYEYPRIKFLTFYDLHLREYPKKKKKKELKRSW